MLYKLGMLIFENFISWYENFFHGTQRILDQLLPVCKGDNCRCCCCYVNAWDTTSQVSACRHALGAASTGAVGESGETYMQHAGVACHGRERR